MKKYAILPLFLAQLASADGFSLGGGVATTADLESVSDRYYVANIRGDYDHSIDKQFSVYGSISPELGMKKGKDNNYNVKGSLGLGFEIDQQFSVKTGLVARYVHLTDEFKLANPKATSKVFGAEALISYKLDYNDISVNARGEVTSPLDSEKRAFYVGLGVSKSF